MKFSISWFSFVELTVSMAIMMVIIVWLSFTMTSIADNLRKWQSEINMYQDISDFFLDTKNISYSTGLVISQTGNYDTLLLYNNFGWVVVWSFDENANFSDYQLSTNNTVYWKKYLWYFNIWTWSLSTILASTWSIYSQKFNNWKLLNQVLEAEYFLFR